MAVGLSIRFAGGNAEHYRTMENEMQVEENPPPGLIFHAAGPIKDGWGVLDFWESREQFDAFLADRIGPAVAALGDSAPPNPPEVKEFPVENMIMPRGE